MKQTKKKETQHLRCQLTVDEKLAKGQEQADTIQAKGALEGDLNAIKTTFKTKLLAADARISELATCLTSGYEMREVDVEITHNYTDGTREVIRLDTEEVTESRELNEHEKQMGLELEGVK